MKKLLSLSMALLCTCMAFAAKTVSVSSPDGKLTIDVTVADALTYSVTVDGNVVLQDNPLSLTLTDETLGEKPVLTGKKYSSADETIRPVVPLKFSEVRNHYNQVRLSFRGGWAVDFRAYDDGYATRFVLNRKGELDVMGETFGLNLPSAAATTVQQPRSFHCNYEDRYTPTTTDTWCAEKELTELPLYINTSAGIKLLVSESDLIDYPCMLLRGNGANSFTSDFARQPLKWEDNGDRSVRFLEEADYMARISGKRTLPWRYVAVGRTDADLVTSTMTCRLASPCQLTGDLSWLKPGQVSWEWWNGACPYGPDVNFVSGYNLPTYKYFIDFAAKYGIEYILMDEGWAKDTRDPYTPNPNVDLHELIRYGQEKGVGIVLWLTWLTVEKNPDLFATFEKWGVKGVKIDFMDRNDQWMVNFYERNVALAAEHHLFIDYHGAFKPAGLEYRYPNLLSYEGVRGMEQMGSCLPENSVWLPFMRNVAGPMDYTPGSMNSFQPNAYSARRPNAGSIGTRAYQMALFVLFESGLQMLADNPTLYYRNDECTRFITSVPTTWDSSVVLSAEAGKYLVEAKRKGNQWFLGGMMGPDPREGRDVTVRFDFLTDEAPHTLTLFEDGINAFQQAMDYRKREVTVRKGDTLTLHMAPNGGFAGCID